MTMKQGLEEGEGSALEPEDAHARHRERDRQYSRYNNDSNSSDGSSNHYSGRGHERTGRKEQSYGAYELHPSQGGRQRQGQGQRQRQRQRHEREPELGVSMADTANVHEGVSMDAEVNIHDWKITDNSTAHRQFMYWVEAQDDDDDSSTTSEREHYRGDDDEDDEEEEGDDEEEEEENNGDDDDIDDFDYI